MNTNSNKDFRECKKRTAKKPSAFCIFRQNIDIINPFILKYILHSSILTLCDGCDFMSQYFFSVQPPEGTGFKVFGLSHLLWIAVIALVAILTVRKYRVMSVKGRRGLELTVCWSAFIIDIARLVLQGVKSGFTPDMLPFHLCGIAVYLSLFNALSPSEIKRDILFSLCMPGAALALLFPAWTYYPICNIFCIGCFLTHALLVIYPLMITLGGGERPDWRNLPKSLIFIAIILPPVYLFNGTFGTDFMFINGTLGVFPLTLFEEWFGNPGYLLGMLMLLILVWIALYLPGTVYMSRKKR